ncbi:hypothetical protein [Methylibium sp.]|uniref:hypothetical protein n=1 Tax=Methylibium sp. TaxID=2067992 RepID=UPI003D113F62
MTTTPVLPSLPEPAMRAAPVGQEAWPFPRVGYYTAEQMNEHARRAIESLSRAPAEPVAFVPVHPKNGPLWANVTADPNPERLPSYPLMKLYAHPTESAGPAVQPADKNALDWLETEVSATDTRCHGVPSYDRDAYWMKEVVLRLIGEARKFFGNAALGESHEG